MRVIAMDRSTSIWLQTAHAANASTLNGGPWVASLIGAVAFIGAERLA
jgi:hypothetical protein